MSSSFFSLGCLYSVLPHDLSIEASENSFFLFLGNLSPSLHGACEQCVNFKYCIVIASLVHVLTHVLTIGTFYDMELIIRKKEKWKRKKKRDVWSRKWTVIYIKCRVGISVIVPSSPVAFPPPSQFSKHAVQLWKFIAFVVCNMLYWIDSWPFSQAVIKNG